MIQDELKSLSRLKITRIEELAEDKSEDEFQVEQKHSESNTNEKIDSPLASLPNFIKEKPKQSDSHVNNIFFRGSPKEYFFPDTRTGSSKNLRPTKKKLSLGYDQFYCQTSHGTDDLTRKTSKQKSNSFVPIENKHKQHHRDPSANLKNEKPTNKEKTLLKQFKTTTLHWLEKLRCKNQLSSPPNFMKPFGTMPAKKPIISLKRKSGRTLSENVVKFHFKPLIPLQKEKASKIFSSKLWLLKRGKSKLRDEEKVDSNSKEHTNREVLDKISEKSKSASMYKYS